MKGKVMITEKDIANAVLNMEEEKEEDLTLKAVSEGYKPSYEIPLIGSNPLKQCRLFTMDLKDGTEYVAAVMVKENDKYSLYDLEIDS